MNPAEFAERTGVLLGCSVGGSFDSEQFLINLMRRGIMRPRPTRFHECASAIEVIADGFGLYGPGLAVATACSSGALAIAAAAEMIQTGAADIMLAGAPTRCRAPPGAASIPCCWWMRRVVARSM